MPHGTACAGPLSPLSCRYAAKPTLEGDGEIFFDREAGRSAARGVLKHPRDQTGAPMHRHVGHILSVDRD